MSTCLLCVCLRVLFVPSACGTVCALYRALVVVCAVRSALYVCGICFHQLWVDLYVLYRFCVYGCDSCVVVLERLCGCGCQGLCT